MGVNLLVYSSFIKHLARLHLLRAYNVCCRICERMYYLFASDFVSKKNIRYLLKNPIQQEKINKKKKETKRNVSVEK